MKNLSVVLGIGCAIVAVTAAAQVRITSFKPNGQLTWSNSFPRGFYSVEGAGSPSGPWNSVGTVGDLDWSTYHLISTQVPLTNAQAFYRVGWIPPDPLGVWDCRAFDAQGTLVITGQMNISSMTLESSNPPVAYRLQGSWDLQYAGPPTNQLYWLGPQIGSGYFAGQVILHHAMLDVDWPTNCVDCRLGYTGAIIGDTWTGTWSFYLNGSGSFEARRVPPKWPIKPQP